MPPTPVGTSLAEGILHAPKVRLSCRKAHLVQKKNLCLGRQRFFFCWRRGRDSNPRVVSHKLISSQPRYDRFDISPYSIVFEFCKAFARPMVKCSHPKFKKNGAFARYTTKTRAFAHSRVTRSVTFRVSRTFCESSYDTLRYLCVFSCA